MTRVRIRAAELRVGDYLPGSRQTVEAINPLVPGHRHVHLAVKRGDRTRLVAWNRSTTMTIHRPEDA